MDIAGQLAAERDIGIVKARYCRFVDTKQWDDLAALFTPDAVLFFPESQAEPCGIADSMAFIASALVAPMVSVHHVHVPEITFTSADTASVIWAMEDQLFFPEGSASALGIGALVGYGHYHEEYRRTADGWKIARLRLDRLRLERTMQPARIM